MDTFSKFTAITIGPLQIQIWGLLVAIGMLFGLLLTVREAKRKKLKAEHFIDIFIIVFLAGIIGSRLLNLVEYWNEYSVDPWRIVQIQHGGLTFFGGALLAFVAVYVYTKLKKLKFWKTIDTLTPGAALAMVIGSIGGYLVGDHIGARTTFPLGSYYNGDLRHVPSLYMAISLLLLFGFLYLMRHFVEKKEGVLGYIFIIWYSVSRFLLDFTRAADLDSISDPRFIGLTLSQIISIVLVVVFVPALVYKLSKK
jgi:phosphatidylglycerol:prolipoprotein diacylglycerol transferase